MANRFPLIVDTDDGNKIKELQVGDNLNLQGCGIINASSVGVNGTISAQAITVNGSSIATVALTGSFNDLVDTPVAFSGDYADLTNKPTIPLTTRMLNDVQNVEPNNGDFLRYDSVAGRYAPQFFDPGDIIGAANLNDLSNVIVPGDASNKFLKYYSGAWRSANITYAEIQNTPTVLSHFTNDVGYLTSETDSQTLSLDGTEVSISNGNTIDLAPILGTLSSDLTGSVFADDSTQLVDGVNGLVVGNVVNSSTESTNLITPTINLVNSSGDTSTISGSGGIDIVEPNERGIRISTTSSQIEIKNDSVADPQASMTISAGSSLNLYGESAIAIRSGDVGSYQDISINGEDINVQANGGTITLGGNEISMTADCAMAAGTYFKFPVYADASARNTAIPSPGVGMVVYISSTSKYTGYVDDSDGGGTPGWVDIN